MLIIHKKIHNFLVSLQHLLLYIIYLRALYNIYIPTSYNHLATEGCDTIANALKCWQ